MVTWVVYIAIGLVIGGAAGFFLGRLDEFSRKEKKAMQDKLDLANKSFTEYKHEVTEHFVATANLVNNLTDSYQAVHEHLAKGAQSLCDHKVAVNRLEVTRPVVLEGNSTTEIEASERSSTIHSVAQQTADVTSVQAAKSSSEVSGENKSEEIKDREKTESIQTKPTDADKAEAGEKVGASDQNDLTMASRMVH